MKNIVIICLLFMGILYSCTDRKAKQSVDSQLSIEQVNEAERLEKENQNLDEIQKDIENSSKELDALLEEINN